MHWEARGPVQRTEQGLEGNGTAGPDLPGAGLLKGGDGHAEPIIC